MPDELLERIDAFAEEHGYTGRSEVVREAARNLLGEFDDERLEGRDPMGLVTVIFDYEATDVEQRLMHLCHDHDDLAVSHVHNHVGDHYCMELFITEGDLEDVPTFVGQVRATQEILPVDYNVTPVDQVGRLA